MRVKAKCPASCGELIQGWLAGGEKLVSYPINWYSEVTIEDHQTVALKTVSPKHTKAWRAFRATCQHFQIPEKEIPPVTLTVSSTIPVAKGMASSTADIAATIVATSTFLGFTMTPTTLVKICLLMEPTDSTVFPSLTLLDHLKGETIIESDFTPTFGVLILEPSDILVTEVFRKDNHKELLLKQASKLETAFDLYEQAVKEKSISKLGEAATISAVANQLILPKKRFSDIYAIAETFNILGINVAHSGTVVGLMYDQMKTDSKELLSVLKEKKAMDYYPRYHFRHSVKGGATVISHS